MTRLYVNRAAVRLNDEDGGSRPVITVRQGDPFCCYSAEISGPSRLVYRAGEAVAQAWVETESEVRAEVDGGTRIVPAEPAPC